MRVCMIVRNSCVRDARVLREAATVASAGHEVTVLAVLEPGVPREERRDGFRIVRVEPVAPWIRRVLRRPPIPTQASGGAEGVAATRGQPLRRPPGAMMVARDVLVTRQLTAAARAIPADVYHAHDVNTLQAARAAARAHRARLVFDAHELYDELTGLSQVERRRWRSIEERLIRHADRVITVSESLADELVRRHAIGRPLVLINCPEAPATPVDPARSPLASLRRDGEMLVLYVGGVSPNRGLEELVDAAERAKGWRLVMMGWGRLHEELRARAPSVTFADPVEPADLVQTASAADVGVIPYVPVGLNNALSLPNKLFEYAHAGLAIAASDLVELRRFIDASGAGIVFPPGDTDAIRGSLDALAADPSRVRAMRDAARAAAAKHDWNVERTKLAALYAELAGITAV